MHLRKDKSQKATSAGAAEDIKDAYTQPGSQAPVQSGLDKGFVFPKNQPWHRSNSNLTSNLMTGATDRPPTPPPKDERSTPYSALSRRSTHESAYASTDEVHVRPYPLSRAGSIYSLSRVSFQSQISQLTSIQLPEAASLAESIRAIPSAASACKTLNDAADQIQRWISKATEVLKGLDAGDDVEWAAAAGREGLSEVDQAINRFESLIQIYISSVEGVQQRADASLVATGDMARAVSHIERIASDWNNVKKSLSELKQQVELAIEWEELDLTAIGEIAIELEDMARGVFEMEERRHQTNTQRASNTLHSVDLGEIESKMDETARSTGEASKTEKRMSLLPDLKVSPAYSPEPAQVADESDLIGLFARLQPVRASLDFLPMRLSSFQTRARDVFPSACSLLESRKDGLEEQFRQLESDIESLRRELSEDRWVKVFRNAGRQAMKMIDSVARSINKVDESLESNTALQHASSTTKKIENYHAKKLHYCPAIERVIAIVERGVRDRLTVNGEILRLQVDLRQRWRTLKLAMSNLDSILEDFRTSSSSNQQLRDSLSSILSSERSAASERSLNSSQLITPGSSPASSVGRLSREPSHLDIHALSIDTKPDQAPEAYGHVTPGGGKRQSSLPIPARKPVPGTPTAATATPQRSTPNSRPIRSAAKTSTPPIPNRPRWNGSTRVNGFPLGQYFKTPEKPSVGTPRQSSAPVRRSGLVTPSSLDKSAGSVGTPGPRYGQTASLQTPESRKLKHHSSYISLGSSPMANQRSRSDSVDESSPVTNTSSRPGSSLGARMGKRISMLPRPISRLSNSSPYAQSSASTTPTASKRTSGTMSSPAMNTGKR